MVCTAALILATKLPTTYDIACDGASVSGRNSARACKSYSGPGRGIYTVQKQPSTLTIQPRSVATRHHFCLARFRKPRIYTLRPSLGLGALYLQRLRLQTFPSAQAGQQQVEAHLRHPTPKQVLCPKTLPWVKHLTKKGNCMFNLNLYNGFDAMGINQEDRDYFTVNVRGQLYRLVGLPMGWSLLPFYFCKMTLSFVNFLRALNPKLLCPAKSNCTKIYLKRTRKRGARILPDIDASLSNCGYGGGSAYLTPTPRQPLGPSRHAPPVNQGLLGTNSNQPPLGNRHRHNARLLLRSRVKTRQDHATSKTTHRTCYTERTYARWPPVRDLQSLAGQAITSSWLSHLPCSSSESCTPCSARGGKASFG
jgi:hypothetical protein